MGTAQYNSKKPVLAWTASGLFGLFSTARSHNQVSRASSATAADVYAHPRAELVRLMDLGLLHRVATGF